MQQRLSIIIPVFNEEKRIKPTLLSLFEYLNAKNFKAEIILVDDGSTDHTDLILDFFSDKIRKITIANNQGKGNAIKVGMLAAEGDYILFMDADLATPLEEIEHFLARKEEADILIGSRVLAQSQVKRTAFRKLAGVVFKIIASILMPLGIKDTQCGFKLFNKESASKIFKEAKISRYSFDMEVLFLAKKYGFVIRELPVAWEDKAGSTVRMGRDSLVMLKDLLKIRYLDWVGAYNNYNQEKGERDVLLRNRESENISEI